MFVHGFAVQAFMSVFLGADEAEALVAPTDPASRASVAEVDQQVGVYLRDIMNDLLDRHGNLGHEAIAPELKQGRYREVVGDVVFRQTNRIHNPLVETAFKAYFRRLVRDARHEYDQLSSNYPLPP